MTTSDKFNIVIEALVERIKNDEKTIIIQNNQIEELQKQIEFGKKLAYPKQFNGFERR